MPARKMLRIKITSTNVESINDIQNRIVGIAKRLGVAIRGPIALPTKEIRITTRKSPCGNGTETWDKWELRLHRRLIYVAHDKKFFNEIIHIPIPPDTRFDMKFA
ncbi:MAG: 30S ribosomal protein S10 [Candidatus Korarchaeota archaeon]